jgi:DNA-binding response OmpR family regulator
MRILIVEDEPKVASFLQKGLEEAGYYVETSPDGRVAEKLLLVNNYHLAIIDINLPGQDGLTLARNIRAQKPFLMILMLTAMGDIENKLSGFEAGADDYMVKPFEFKELLARVKVFDRRLQTMGNPNEKIFIANLEIDLKSHTVFRDQVRIDLTPKEYALLEYMVKNQGKLLTRADIAQNVWDINFDTGTNVIDVYINFLRKKIDRNYSPKLIHTQVGMGYIFKVDE